MTKKHHHFLLKNIFFFILLAIFYVALYFFVYYLFYQPVVSQTISQPVSQIVSPTVSQNSPPLEITPLPSAAVISKVNIAISTADTAISTVDLSDTSLSFGSFQESFVAPANIDLAQTTLYRDNRATAMFFTPDYSWETANDTLINLFKDNFTSLKFNNFTGPYKDERCLGNNCLEQKGADLFYNGKAVVRPPELSDASVVAVSLGELTKNWLVGFTIKDGSNYRGQVFYFNGEKFTPLVLPAEIFSSSFGLFGFGGEEADFLVIYGATNAVAYRVHGGVATNMSRWFSPRVMVQGFKPEILRVGRGSDIGWYVYSSTLNRPQLIKLWQNDTADIVGEAVFEKLFSGSTASAGFKLVSSQNDRIILLARLEEGGAEAWRIFTDSGFKNTQAATLVTKPITHDGAASLIIINSIVRADFDLDQDSAQFVKFLFSGEGEAWRKISSGADPYFSTGKIKNYRFQIIFPASSDRFHSPFLDSILFNYYAHKVQS